LNAPASTSTYRKQCGLRHTNADAVPVSVSGEPASYLAAAEWCAAAGAAATTRIAAHASA
jgi:hypothetical protein